MSILIKLFFCQMCIRDRFRESSGTWLAEYNEVDETFNKVEQISQSGCDICMMIPLDQALLISANNEVY